jgi:hypothetical protein
VITQLDTTSLLLPGQIAEVHRFGALIVHEAQRSAPTDRT